MNKNFTNKLEAYLLGKLNAQEKADLEIELSKNPALKEELTQLELEHQVMELLVEDDLINDIQGWKEEKKISSSKKQGEKVVPLFSRFKLMGIAASLLLLLGLFFWMNNDSTHSSPTIADQPTTPIEEDEKSNPIKKEEEIITPIIEEQKTEIVKNKKKETPVIEKKKPEKVFEQPKEVIVDSKKIPKEQRDYHQEPKVESNNNYIAIAKSYYKDIDFSSQVRGADSDWESITSDLKEGRLENAIKNLNTLEQNDADNLTTKHYLGLAYYQHKKFNEAIPYLKTIAESTHLNAEDSQWLLILSYLQTNNTLEANKVIEPILKDEEHSYFMEVSEISFKIK